MGIYYNEAFLEGQQADEYRARKAREEEERKRKEDERNERRYGKKSPGNQRHTSMNDDRYDEVNREDNLRGSHAAHMAAKNSPHGPGSVGMSKDYAAANKHFRRHPEDEGRYARSMYKDEDTFRKYAMKRDQRLYDKYKAKNESVSIFDSIKFD